MGAYNYFTFSSHVQNLLFKDFTVSSAGAFIAIFVGVAIFTFLYELLQPIRQHLVLIYTRFKDESNPSNVMSESQKTVSNCMSSLPKKTIRRLKFHCLQTILHMLQLFMGYIIMLIVMHYNVWIFIAVIVTTSLFYYFHELLLSRKPLVVPVEMSGSSL